jgi:CBS-domain-containing membrane protein
VKITRYKNRTGITMTHTEFSVLQKVYEVADVDRLHALLNTSERKAYTRRRSGRTPYLQVDVDKSKKRSL